MTPSNGKDDGCNDLLEAIEKVYNAHIIYRLATDEQFSLHSERASKQKLEEVNELVPLMEAELKDSSLNYTTIIACLRNIRHELEEINYPVKPTLAAIIESKANVEPICALLLADSNDEEVTVDIDGLLTSIVDCMAVMCSQARDVNIAQLRKVTSIPKKIGGILVTLKEMAIDLANYMIMAVRGTCRSHWKPWVRQKFDEIMQLSSRHDIDILQDTRQWLKNTYTSDEPESRTKEHLIERAFANLLTSNKLPPFPCTLEFEAKSLSEVKTNLYSHLLLKCIHMIVNELNLDEWPQTMDDNINVLIKDYPKEPIFDVLQSIIVELENFYKQTKKYSNSTIDRLSPCISQLVLLDMHPLFSVYINRLQKTFIEMLKCKTTAEAELILKQSDHAIYILKLLTNFDRVVEFAELPK
ncbi:hypothetical protein GJ496_000817 [Pomphorhynchus laevis]|nr:hypothetical protein GJ496_000817 [Pomphorhynchus laevis]